MYSNGNEWKSQEISVINFQPSRGLKIARILLQKTNIEKLQGEKLEPFIDMNFERTKWNIYRLVEHHF